jgi:hypothetical protein
MTLSVHGKSRRRISVLGLVATVAVLGAVLFGMSVNGGGSVTAQSGNSDNVTLCHRTNSDTNPYVVITVDPAGAYNGHYLEHQGPIWDPTLKDQHIEWGDIIPPFEFNGATYSLNWPDGEAIFDAGCEIVATATPTETATEAVETPTNTPTATPTGTLTPTNTPTATPTGTLTATNTPTATPTGTLTPTNTPTATPTGTLTPTATVRQPRPSLRRTEAALDPSRRKRRSRAFGQVTPAAPQAAWRRLRQQHGDVLPVHRRHSVDGRWRDGVRHPQEQVTARLTDSR